MIISTVSYKGGTGKTTVAVNLAVYFAKLGKSVLLIDADKGNALKWSGLRPETAAPVMAVMLNEPAALRNNINNLSDKADVVIIDGTPAINEITAVVMLVSDIVIFPIKPSAFDVWAFDDHLLPKIKDVKAMKPELETAILLNHVDARQKLAVEVTEFFTEYAIPLLTSRLGYRAVYQNSILTGFGALEMKNKIARDEVNALGQEIRLNLLIK